MTSENLHVVTGAFGYSGKYIAARLVAQGCEVRTLTNSRFRPNPFGDQVGVYPLSFEKPGALVDSLRGAAVLYNTYWVRFNHARFTYGAAVANTLTLFDAARQARVGHVVHVSITNPSEDSPLEYFRSKARLEHSLIDSGLSYSILRPAVLFGREDILINNIAWILRRFPIFPVFGSGQYRLQPIYIDDFAALAVTHGRDRTRGIIDAIGPETFTYRQLVRALGVSIGRIRPIVSVPPWAGYVAAAVLGAAVGDIPVTRDEISGLMMNLLVTNSASAGTTRLTDWARDHTATLGTKYASELARRTNRRESYQQL